MQGLPCLRLTSHRHLDSIRIDIQRTEVAAKECGDSLPESMKELEQQEQEKRQRLKQFRESARAIGEEVARQGLPEEKMIELLEESRQEVFDENYANTLRNKTTDND
jgi:hypothetical protein